MNNTRQPLNGKKENITLNQESMKELVDGLIVNDRLFRKEWMERVGNPNRNIYKECGYPDAESYVTSYVYELLYRREGIAKRVIEAWPKESWQVQPEVTEITDSEETTQFEQDWYDLSQNLEREDPDPNGAYQDEYGSPIWDYLRRLDIEAGKGEYGVLLLGLDDGLGLEEPVKGFSEVNSTPSILDTTQNEVKWVHPSFEDNRLPIYRFVNNSKNSLKLIYLRVFPQHLAEIVEVESNPTSPRYNKPVRYRLTFNSTFGGISGTNLLSQSNILVHWTRVIHFADNPTSGEITGIPRLLPVLNNILGLQKLYCSSPEMCWKGAFNGTFFGTDPSLGANVRIDENKLKDSYENYQNGLQRILFGGGLVPHSLAPNVSDVTPHIKAQLEIVAITLDMPMRILMGSERGELSSGQDEDSHNDKTTSRQCYILSPKLVAPFVSRLILLKVLTRPKGFSITWPPIAEQSRTDKADCATKETNALSVYVTTGVEAVVPPREFLSQVMGWDDEVVNNILEASMASADGEIETKSPLLGMVGGITGVIELFKSAKDGAVSEEQLKQILMLFFKLSEDLADQVIADGLSTAAQDLREPPPVTETPPSPIKVKPGEGLVNPDGTHVLSPSPVPTPVVK